MVRGYTILNDVLSLKNIVEGFLNDRGTAGRTNSSSIPVNLNSTDDSVTVTVLAPGVFIEDISIELVDRNINITLDRKNSQSDANYLRRERAFGSFSTSVSLPWRVNQDSIKASLHNGILTITAKKSEEAKAKKIEIK